MDKKIILSLVIVALIGIVAATYQININDDNILNPFSSVDTEDSPITDTLATPAQAASQGANNQISDAQKQAQAQQAKDQAQAAQGQDDSQNQQQQQGSALITAENPVTVNQGQQSGDEQTGQRDNNGGNNPTTDSDSNPSPSPSQKPTQNPTPSPNPQPTPNPTPSPNPQPTPNPTPSPNPQPDNNILTIAQAYSYIIKQKIGDLQIQQGSGYIDTGANNEKYIVFLAHNPKGPNPNEVFHVWVPQNKNSGFTWFIEEDGTGPEDADPVNEGNDTQTNTNNTNDTN
ncbi:hypothetical protein [Methanosphaera cuniculi]|uniref:hypothetical protein n=1 Tax=Methanosphaera cuniculi TaxID=1077256 RepID=UPI0026EE73CF|nr:hypothetical protein [Methanosphaera cuniculi]